MIGTVLALIVSACGGGVDAEGSDTSVSPVDVVVDTGGDGFTVEADGGEVILGGTADRPDWLPSWVELPNGLEITTQFTNPGVGEAAVLGIVEGEAQEELLAEALILVQSNGFVVGGQYDTSGGKGFEAEHSSDGSRVVFGVGEYVEGSALWSMEFFDDAGDGAEDEQAANDESTSKYDTPGVMTVTVGGQTFDVIGSCDLGDGSGNFSADDSFSVFDVFPANTGGLGAVGTATLVVDGERITSWGVFQGMEVIGLELTDNSIFYEGGMQESVFGAEPEIGSIEIACG
jgi:hypothetical protein